MAGVPLDKEERELVDNETAKPPNGGIDDEGARGEVSSLDFSVFTHDHGSVEITILTREECWLYSHVAMSTINEPRMKVMDILKSKSATDARNEMTILRLVANPFRMLSEYLMTMAVTSPPNTWIDTVVHAHTPKLLNRMEMKPWPVRNPKVSCANMIGARAGRSENTESCTLRIQRSVCEFLRTISKYTPANPEVKQAATTAKSPFMAFISSDVMAPDP